jgi:hypothetical protein
VTARAARPIAPDAVAPRSGWAASFAPLYRSEGRTYGSVLQALRLAYLGIFLFQTLLAMTVAWVLGALAPHTGRPHEVLAVVLFLIAALQLPTGVFIALQLLRRPGVGSALAAVTVAAVVLSSSAWFAALMVLSRQRPLWWSATLLLVALAYAAGLLLTPRAARVALSDPPAPNADPPATA